MTDTPVDLLPEWFVEAWKKLTPQERQQFAGAWRTTEAMPSKRMVPEQDVAESSEDLVRLAAAKDAEIAALTERRDRAMKVVEAAKALGEAMNNCQSCDKEFAALWAALDAEAAAETAPSLPETP